MPRHHTIWDASLQQQVDVPFTSEEETARDAEELRSREVRSTWEVQRQHRQELRGKLADDSITDAELRELIKLVL